MGFFSDLKEDLNQAVNELMPGEKDGTDAQENRDAQKLDGNAGENMDKEDMDKEDMDKEDMDKEVASQPKLKEEDSGEIPDDEETLKQLADLEQILQNLEMPKQDEPQQSEAVENDQLNYESLGDPEEIVADQTSNEEDKVVNQPETASAEEIKGAASAEEAKEAAAAEEAKEAASAEETKEPEAGLGTEFGMAISLSEEDSKLVEKTDDDMKETMGEFQDAVAALKDSIEVQKAQEQDQEDGSKAQEQGQENLEEELRATFGAKEGEETVEDYLHEEAIRTGAEIIDKSWVLDLKGMETMDETAVITAGMRVKGDILSNGSADISGEVIGNVQIKGKLNITGKVNGNSKAQEIFADSARVQGDMISDNTVKIGVDSVVIGNIEATSAVIAGAVKGTIDVKGPVILDATAVVLGNIRAKSMQINNGARIEGMCVLCYAEQSAAKFFEEQATL